MTVGEACALLVQTTRQLSTARAECESWRLVALATMQQVSDLTRQLEVLDERQYIHRTRTQDERDLFLDQCDLRRRAA